MVSASEFISLPFWNATSSNPAVPVSALVDIAASLALRGESCHVLAVNGLGVLELLRASEWDISGGISPSTWAYRVKLYSPGSDRPIERTIPAGGVVHCRVGTAPGCTMEGSSGMATGEAF